VLNANYLYYLLKETYCFLLNLPLNGNIINKKWRGFIRAEALRTESTGSLKTI
jgi:hypothetical protein